MSDMDSECDDVFAEDSKSYSADSKNEREDDGRHLMNRKRRRGVIEKRRRDRINNSLSELRRLVPAAYEKQGSAKLEKAEILQMTVDHLKLMHSRGLDVFNLEPHNSVTDYQGLGFRECASEVARYLVSYEGLDLQDPLKLRLMSHLQCFTAHPSSHWFTSLPHFSSSSSSTISKNSISEYSSTSSSSRLSSSSSIMMFSVGSPRTSRLPISPIASYSRPLKPYRPWGGTELAY